LAVKEKKITAKNAKNAKHLGGERKNRKWPFGKNGFVKREIEPILPFFTAYGMTVFLHQEKRRNRKLAAISILPNAKFAFPYLAIQVIHRVFALIATDYLSHFDF
ncbi:MAG: hypothetical protein GX946_09260, partial [Oligosphaeraceae bacterium]|nr:hypothetical protein [Oligosphaeraceae bacterium]